MELGLAGKTALITGGTSGIGLAVARRLGEEGCNIAICGRKQSEARRRACRAEFRQGQRLGGRHLQA